MRITCPNCQAVYEIADLLAFGIRKLRCVCCGAAWEAALRPVAPAPKLPEEQRPALVSEPAPGPVPAPTIKPTIERVSKPEAVRTPIPQPWPLMPASAPVSRQSGSVSLVAAWAASAVVLVGGSCAAWRYQDALCHAWPPLGRLAALVASLT